MTADIMLKAAGLLKNGRTRGRGVLDNIGLSRKKMYPVVIRDEADLAREIARIANIARLLEEKLRRENREMTREEAYTELAHSASLLKAVLSYTKGKSSRTRLPETAQMRSGSFRVPTR